MTSIEFYTSGGQAPFKKVDYFYGPLGRRLAKHLDGVLVENYLYNGDNIHIAEGLRGERLYIHSDRIDDPLMMRNGANYYSIHSDHLGSVQSLNDNSGQVVEQYGYNAYGETKIFNSTNTEISDSTVGNVFGYTGREFDEESDVMYYRARYYSPAQGRFLTEDPIGFQGQDENLYRYTFNNPILFKEIAVSRMR